MSLPNARHQLARQRLVQLGLLIALAMFLAWPTTAQDAEETGELAEAAGAMNELLAGADEPADSTDEDEDGETSSGQDFGDIDALLAQDEDALYTDERSLYEPGGRRDPFRSLLRRAEPEDEGAIRPEGIAGLLIDDLRLEGIFVTPAGPAAQVQAASDQISYLLRPGDQLWDGDVVDVTVDEIVFKQSVDDPTALKPFREVAMRLYEP